MSAPGPEEATSLVGQNLVVVGAASGIGRAAALRLASAGGRVACLDVDLPGAQTTAYQAKHEGAGEAMAGHADVTDQGSVSVVLREVEEILGPVHGLVNCAGITGVTNRKTHEVELEDFDRVYRVNLRGALIVSQAVLPGMVQRAYGRLLHIASIAGKEGNAGMVAYSATKAGVIGMVKSQGKEYAGTGVTVNALAPAVIQTPLVDAMPEEQVQYMTSRIPMGRLGALSEVAELIAWIVSPACSFTTGFTFDLSGGRAVY